MNFGYSPLQSKSSVPSSSGSTSSAEAFLRTPLGGVIIMRRYFSDFGEGELCSFCWKLVIYSNTSE